MAAETTWLRDDIREAAGDRNIFEFIAGLDGEVYRALEYRRTFSAEFGGKRYFVKYHRGTGTGEILKNLLQLRLPVTSSRNEWRALNRLGELGISVPSVAAYGRRGWLSQTCESFIVTDDVGTRENLEDLTRDWGSNPPPLSEKLALIREVAAISRQMHSHGICHRDFYLCHFLVSNREEQQLTLIDLHRALVKNPLARRWVIKDIGSLYYSTMEIGLKQRDLFRFIRAYTNVPLKHALEQDRDFWEKVLARASRLKNKHG